MKQIIGFFKNIYRQISSFGISPDTPHLAELTIRGINWLAVIVIGVISIASIYYWSVLTEYEVIYMFFLVSFYATYLLLNGLGKARVAVLFFFIFFPIGNMISTIFFAHDLSDAVWFSLSVMIGFVAYESKTAQIRIVVWNLCCYVGGVAYNIIWGRLCNEEIPVVDRHILAIISISILCYLGWIMVRDNRRFRKTIMNQNEDLKEMNQALHEVNTDLKNFTYITSHDLKTPLNSILSFQRLIERKVQGIDDPSLKKYLYYANSSAENMMTILNDLRQFSELAKELSKQQFQYVDIRPIIEQISTEYKNTVEKQGEVVVKGDLPPIKALASHVRLIFQNLIGNGLKYNESDKPQITISGSRTQTGTSIYVRDNGIGMDAKYLGEIFEPFKRLHTKRNYEGTGFGLAICKRIIEKMDGNIKVHSEIGKGSTFSIHFPNETDTLAEIIENDSR